MLEKLFAQYAAGHTHPLNRFFHLLGIPTIIISLVMWLIHGTSTLFWVLFSVGWFFQFVGHAIERTIPEFIKNPIFLIVGPLYFFDKLWNKFKKLYQS